MDNLRTFVAHVIKFRFWYIAGICVLASLGTWFWVNSSLGAARLAREEVIGGKIREIDNVLAVSVPVGGEEVQPVKTHPNAETKKGMEDEIKKATISLLKAWELRYAAQTTIQIWPEEIIGSEKFVEQFTKYNPPEKYPDLQPTPITDAYCQLYSAQIRKRLPVICEIIRAKWLYDVAIEPEPATSVDPGVGDEVEGSPDQPQEGADGSGEDRPGEPQTDAGGPATPAPPPSPTAVVSKVPNTVIWEGSNQALWQGKVTIFKGRNGSKFPTGYQVLALQQDLWLLEAMFKVIANVNGDTLANDLAPIEKIYYVVYGQEARTQLGKIMTPDPKWGGMVPATPVIADLGAVAAESELRAGEGGEAGTAGFSNSVPANLVILAPFHGRYVDRNFQPLTIERVHTAIASPMPPATDFEIVVAKRLPFRIAMRMSESSIASFIAACSNSPFEFEVNQVRVNRHETDDQTGADSNALKSPNSGPTSIEARVNDDVDVEFYGIVRIYNPVDRERIDMIAGVVNPDDGT